ncbi:hypothetical protein D9M68_306480 [compost metagenome]
MASSNPTAASLDARQDAFVHACAALTGFTPFDILGTGLVRQHLDFVTAVAGADAIDALTDRIAALPPDEPARDRAMRAAILADEWLGPIARSLIKLWYVGTWFALPPEWQARYGVSPLDVTTIPSSESYVEALVWLAIGAHPPGAKQQGFGAWAEPPGGGTIALVRHRR